MFRDYMMLALKSLRRRGIRSWLTMLGIIIGIAAVISLISLVIIFRTSLTCSLFSKSIYKIFYLFI